MGILNRYILREIAVPLVLALVVISFLAVANELRERMHSVPLTVLQLSDLGRLTLYFLPTLVSFIVPITYMMGILLAFGRLAHDGEIIAMKAAGVPLKRVVLPVLVGGVLLSGLCFVLQDRVQPIGLAKAARLMTLEMPLRVTIDVLPPGKMQRFGDWQVYIGSKDAASSTLKNIDILDGRGWMYYADSARLVKENGQSSIVMTNGYIVLPEQNQGFPMMRFPEARLNVPQMVTEKSIGNRRRELSLAQLFRQEQEERTRYAASRSPSDKDALNGTRTEICDRISLPLACLAVSLVAAPLGVRARRSGKSYTFAVGAGIFLVYYVLKFLLEPKSLHSLAEMLLRVSAPNLVLLAAGLVFLWRVDRV